MTNPKMKMTKMTLTTLTTNQKHNYAEFLGSFRKSVYICS